MFSKKPSFVNSAKINILVHPRHMNINGYNLSEGHFDRNPLIYL